MLPSAYRWLPGFLLSTVTLFIPHDRGSEGFCRWTDLKLIFFCVLISINSCTEPTGRAQSQSHPGLTGIELLGHLWTTATRDPTCVNNNRIRRQRYQGERSLFNLTECWREEENKEADEVGQLSRTAQSVNHRTGQITGKASDPVLWRPASLVSADDLIIGSGERD